MGEHFSNFATLEIFSGPMGSGKTTNLLYRLIERQEENEDESILYINHSSDTRYGTSGERIYSTHNPRITFNLADMGIHGKKGTIVRDVIKEYEDECGPVTVVGIDEAQFFEDLVDTVLNLVEGRGVDVYVSGLFADAERETFGGISKLMNYADKITILEAKCALCSRVGIRRSKASFSRRIPTRDDEDVAKRSKIDIGGKEKYASVCRYHYNVPLETYQDLLELSC